jgi:hypothetical protein
VAPLKTAGGSGITGTRSHRGDIMSFSFIISIGKYGGFYITNGNAMKRLCLGCIAFTLIIPEFDIAFHKVMESAGYDML